MDIEDSKILDECFKELLNNDGDLVKTISKYDYKTLDELATSLLLRFFINERGVLADIQQENASAPNFGIRKKYNNFNPEHVMGYRIVRQNGTIKVIPDQKRMFKVCSAKDMDIREIMEENNFFKEITNNILDSCELPKVPYAIDSGMEVITSTPDNSKYLYGQSDNSIYFKGTPPILLTYQEYTALKSAVPFFVDSFIEGKIKNDSGKTSFYDSEEEFHKRSLTFKDCIAGIAAAASHNQIFDKGNYLILNLIYDKKQIIISKSWMKAVAETLIKAKDQIPSVNGILKKIHEYEAYNGKIKIGNGSIRDFLMSTFIINDNALDFMVKLVNARFGDEVKANKGFTQSSYYRLASLIDLYQENFSFDRFDSGILFPSKLFIYLLSMVGDAHYQKAFLDDPTTFKNMQKDYCKTLTNMLYRKANTPFSYNTETLLKNLQKVTTIFCLEHQRQFNETLPFYYHHLVYSIPGIQETSILQEDMKNALIITSLNQKIHNSYEAISYPISYYGRDLSLDNQSLTIQPTSSPSELDAAISASFFILKQHPTYFDDFKLYINQQPFILDPNKTIFTFSKNISQVRNSSVHSAISLVVEEDGKTAFVFNDLKSLPTSLKNQRYYNRKNEKRSIYKIKSDPLKMFDFYSSGVFDSTTIPAPEFFDRLNELEGLTPYESGRKTAIFNSDGMTIINNDNGKIDSTEIPYDSPEWKKVEGIIKK